MALECGFGPFVVHGNLNPQQNSVPSAGASMTVFGDGVFDVRQTGRVGVATGLFNKVYGLTNHAYSCFVDAVPQTAAVARIAAAANVTSGTAMTLVSAQGTGVSPNIPVIPFGGSYQSTTPTKVLAIDFGFTTGNTTSGSAAVVIPAGTANFFIPGTKIIISGAGASANNPLITTVVSASGTALTVADKAGQSVTGAQIGNADPGGVAAWPWRVAGPHADAETAVWHPYEGIARAISITGSASATGGAFAVIGYDIDWHLVHETITATSGATTTNGKKTYRGIVSVTPQFSDAHNYSVGTIDTFGFPLRSDLWEYMNIFWNGAFVSVSTGWTVADGATATATTGDTRGTYAVQSASDGTKRLAIFMSIPQRNLYAATNLDPSGLFGVTQF